MRWRHINTRDVTACSSTWRNGFDLRFLPSLLLPSITCRSRPTSVSKTMRDLPARFRKDKFSNYLFTCLHWTFRCHTLQRRALGAIVYGNMTAVRVRNSCNFSKSGAVSVMIFYRANQCGLRLMSCQVMRLKNSRTYTRCYFFSFFGAIRNLQSRFHGIYCSSKTRMAILESNKQ